MSARWIEASDFDKDRAETAGEVLRRWVTTRGLLKPSDRQRLWGAWQRLLGPEAAQTSLEGLKNHVATFTVDSSALLSELKNFRKQELLESLHREVKTYFVRDIKFRLEKRRGGG
jgi:hypothetical protein